MALNHSVTGPTTYTLVGTPTFVGGVMSNTGKDDYLQIPAIGSFAGKEIEAVFKYNVDTTVPQPSSYSFVFLGSRGSTNLQVCFAGNGTAVDVYYAGGHKQFAGITNLLNYKYFKFVKNADDTTTTIYFAYEKDNWVYQMSTTTVPYSTDVSVINQLGRTPSAVTTQEAVSVDLNETYIKVNGAAWFGVCPVAVKHINYGTSVGYTNVGSPTIRNGVVSGFDTDTYLNTSCTVEMNALTEIGIRFKIPTVTGYAGYMLASVADFVNIEASKSEEGITVRCGSEHTLSILQNYSYDTWYCIKLLIGSSTIQVYHATDGLAYTYDASIEKADISTSSSLRLGAPNWGTITAGHVFKGSIDLNGTYIKQTGHLWFYKPCTNYLVKDGKLVFADSGLYIEENGVKTYATQEAAPVPSGYTYGSTTTPAIGWVDMRTQAFTAAPAGAILGKDE